MADWSKPALTDTYANFLTYLSDRIKDAAMGNDPAKTTVTNPIANMIRWNSANGRWEIYNGTSWGVLAATYAISVSGNAGTATKWATGRTIATTGDATGTSAAFDGSANCSFALTLATVNANTGTWGAAASVPQFTVNAKGLVTAAANVPIAIAWSQITSGKPTTRDGYGITDVPKVNGTGASGTWGISISGNAATATTAAACSGNAATATTAAACSGNAATATSAGTVTGTVASAATGTTQVADTNDTRMATTAFVIGQAAGTTPLIESGSGAAGTSKKYARADHVHPAVAIASQAEVLAGTDNAKMVTPLAAQALPGRLIKYSIITSSNASWAKQSATTQIVVCAVGAGGGGGAANPSCGEGGNAGAQAWAVTTSPSATYNATVGAGGSGGAAGSGNDGAIGGTTSFGALVSASGGRGGRGATIYTGHVSGYGAHGESNIGIGGAGGVSAGGGSAAANSGAGGGGSGSPSVAGGAGGSGVIYVWEFV